MDPIIACPLYITAEKSFVCNCNGNISRAQQSLCIFPPKNSEEPIFRLSLMTATTDNFKKLSLLNFVAVFAILLLQYQLRLQSSLPSSIINSLTNAKKQRFKNDMHR